MRQHADKKKPGCGYGVDGLGKKVLPYLEVKNVECVCQPAGDILSPKYIQAAPDEGGLHIPGRKWRSGVCVGLGGGGGGGQRCYIHGTPQLWVR